MKKIIIFIVYFFAIGAFSSAIAGTSGNTSVCPVMNGEINKSISFTYKDKDYYFCCPVCVNTFKANPEKYISKIKSSKFEAYQFAFSPEKIVVKKGDIVQLSVSSRDVPHGIYIKEYNINVPVRKGEVKTIEFLADKPGVFPITCSVYCGRDHSTMSGQLIVES